MEYYSYSYLIQCPECRREVNLPQSGKAEDFPTNFALMKLVSDLEAQNKSKTSIVQASLTQGDAAGPKCPQHKIPMKFYCKTCKIQICDQCLLGDHKLGQHCSVSAADVAVNLSHQLQRSTEKLQYYEQEKQALGDKINEAIQNCQQDNVKLQEVIQQNLQKEIQKLHEAATKMLNQIGEKVQARSCAHADLQKKYSNVNSLHSQIKGKCSTLQQNFQQVDLSQSTELEHIDQHIEKLKNQIDSLKATCQSTPANVGLVITPAQCELGITLSQVTPKPMILQASGQVQNRNNSPHGNNAAGQLRGAFYQYVPLPRSGHSSISLRHSHSFESSKMDEVF